MSPSSTPVRISGVSVFDPFKLQTAVAAAALVSGGWQLLAHRVLGLVDYRLTFGDVWGYMFDQLSPHLIGAQIASVAEVVAIVVGLAGLFLRWHVLPLTGMFACSWFLTWTVSAFLVRLLDGRGIDVAQIGTSIADGLFLVVVLGVGWAWAIKARPRRVVGAAVASLPILVVSVIVALS